MSPGRVEHQAGGKLVLSFLHECSQYAMTNVHSLVCQSSRRQVLSCSFNQSYNQTTFLFSAMQAIQQDLSLDQHTASLSDQLLPNHRNKVLAYLAELHQKKNKKNVTAQSDLERLKTGDGWTACFERVQGVLRYLTREFGRQVAGWQSCHVFLCLELFCELGPVVFFCIFIHTFRFLL